MRIKELLEGRQFNELDWVTKTENKSEPNFDVADDLVFYMNNDDDIYRRHLYPLVNRCIESIKSKKKINSDIFKNAVRESYKSYLENYPIRELPNEIDDKTCKEACDKLHEEIHQHINDGRYKD